MAGLEQSLFQLKFTAKSLNRQATKAAKEELSEKAKTKKAMMQGNSDIAQLYAQNAIRKANERVNLLRLASRIDAVASRVQTAVTMRSVTGNMASVIKGMDKALQTMNLEKISLVMDKFENQFEDLDASTNYYESATNNVNALTTPQEEVDELMSQIADEAGIEMKQGLNETKVDIQTPPVANVTEEKEDKLAERLPNSSRVGAAASGVAASAIGAVRHKVSLPDLDWEFDALEPYISGQINEIHYTKHHQTYVTGYNTAIEQFAEAKQKGEVKKTVELQKLINFHGGGYTNHCLFWKNLAPKSQGGGEPPSEDSELAKKIKEQYGTLENLQNVANAKLAGIQGSGWAFLVKNKENGGQLDIVTTANQDTVTGPLVPLVAIDAWEHAYYLQYQNVKADYFKAIWNVVNWKEAEKRYVVN
ncbi:hypothetical protein CA3LBN_001797 [Candidozyma haemuli]|uniref:superoxide dismutase n=1 Tax=Candidozyma haemuli TaxID=45357 RepID=A0ABX8I3F1_9ASCO|nr:hypothetical protein CA3LBN_001797 [[Candida] haemuloni]